MQGIWRDYQHLHNLAQKRLASSDLSFCFYTGLGYIKPDMRGKLVLDLFIGDITEVHRNRIGLKASSCLSSFPPTLSGIAWKWWTIPTLHHHWGTNLGCTSRLENISWQSYWHSCLHGPEFDSERKPTNFSEVWQIWWHLPGWKLIFSASEIYQRLIKPAFSSSYNLIPLLALQGIWRDYQYQHLYNLAQSRLKSASHLKFCMYVGQTYLNPDMRGKSVLEYFMHDVMAVRTSV